MPTLSNISKKPLEKKSYSKKPQACFDLGCPLAETGKGFCLGSGDPTTAKLAVLLEGPGNEELSFTLKPDDTRLFYATKKECDEEIRIRKRDYPTLPDRYITQGVPVVGRSGYELAQWALPTAGLARSGLFIDNTLRCLPPKQGDSHYPQGAERKLAEACCRHYDRWGLFKPDISIVSIHPASVVRETTGLWLQVKNLEKARDFVKQGLKTIILAGGKAVKWWLGYGETVIRWQGHYEWNDSRAQQRRRERLAKYALAVPKEKGKRGKTKDAEETKDGSTNKRRGRRATIEEILGG